MKTDEQLALELADMFRTSFGERSKDRARCGAEAIAEALATARAEGAEEKWIPVNDGTGVCTCPPGAWVLLWVADGVGEIQMGQCDGDGEWWAFSRPHGDDANGKRIKVTHWMPLPSEPASERKA